MKFLVGQRVIVGRIGNATILYIDEEDGSQILVGFHHDFGGHDGNSDFTTPQKYWGKCWWVCDIDIQGFVDNELEDVGQYED